MDGKIEDISLFRHEEKRMEFLGISWIGIPGRSKGQSLFREPGKIFIARRCTTSPVIFFTVSHRQLPEFRSAVRLLPRPLADK